MWGGAEVCEEGLVCEPDCRGIVVRVVAWGYANVLEDRVVVCLESKM